jgi:serine/threonine protein kinase
MLDPAGRVVSIDFGSARYESHTYLDKLYGGGGITRISLLGYTAPEQPRFTRLPLGWLESRESIKTRPSLLDR